MCRYLNISFQVLVTLHDTKHNLSIQFVRGRLSSHSQSRLAGESGVSLEFGDLDVSSAALSSSHIEVVQRDGQIIVADRYR